MHRDKTSWLLSLVVVGLAFLSPAALHASFPTSDDWRAEFIRASTGANPKFIPDYNQLAAKIESELHTVHPPLKRYYEDNYYLGAALCRSIQYRSGISSLQIALSGSLSSSDAKIVMGEMDRCINHAASQNNSSEELAHHDRRSSHYRFRMGRLAETMERSFDTPEAIVPHPLREVFGGNWDISTVDNVEVAIEQGARPYIHRGDSMHPDLTAEIVQKDVKSMMDSMAKKLGIPNTNEPLKIVVLAPEQSIGIQQAAKELNGVLIPASAKGYSSKSLGVMVVSSGKDYEVNLAHEIVHLLIPSPLSDYPWLEEGLAEKSAQELTDHWHPNGSDESVVRFDFYLSRMHAPPDLESVLLETWKDWDRADTEKGGGSFGKRAITYIFLTKLIDMDQLKLVVAQCMARAASPVDALQMLQMAIGDSNLKKAEIETMTTFFEVHQLKHPERLAVKAVLPPRL
jgi:hypothetical protein